MLLLHVYVRVYEIVTFVKTRDCNISISFFSTILILGYMYEDNLETI